jgi:hypothetical protein
VVNENETAYRTIVDLVGNGNFLRQTFVSRAGHCAFTPAETIAAVDTLLTRVKTGNWPTVEADALNAEATALGRGFNIFGSSNGIVATPPAFVDFQSGPYPRPFDSLVALCPKDSDDDGSDDKRGHHSCPFAFFLQH